MNQKRHEAETLSPRELNSYLHYAVELAQKAGQHTAKYFAKGVEVELKSDQSPVTVADRETEQLCRRFIAEDWPTHGVIGEEFGNTDDKGSGLTWVIDPIDGTKSFISGLPLYTVLLALLHNGRPVLGVIHQPILAETVFAAQGLGCFYNDKPTSLRKQDELAKAWLMCTDPTALHKAHPAPSRRLFDSVYLSRSWGDGYGYLMVASGRADIMVDPGMFLWDVACIKPIIEEAGGIFSDLSGGLELGTSCLVANPILHPQVLTLFNTTGN